MIPQPPISTLFPYTTLFRSIRNAGSFPRTMRTAPINRPCTFTNAAGIQRFSARAFISFVTRPLRNIVASDPLTRRSEEHTSELQSPDQLVCRLLLEKKKQRQ